MMNATALVIGSDPQKKLQLVKNLSETQLFDRIKPLQTISALFQHLKNASADIICWAMDSNDNKVDWIDKLQGNDNWHDLPLVAFASEQQDLLKGFSLGASDALQLSTDQPELIARLQGHLKRWHRMLALRQSKERLQQMALTDALTGLGNRATFDLSLKQATARSKRSGAELSLLMIDLDHFKQFNDNYGHQVGDEVLREVAKALDHSSRDTDICCRYGGEEFAIILPDASIDQAQIVANRIHKQVGRASAKLAPNRQPITVSIGISSLNLQGAHRPADLIEEADRALYQAKKNGRNRTEIWHHTVVRALRSEPHYPSLRRVAFA